MTNKEKFIKIVQKEIFDNDDIYVENYPDDYEGAYEFFKELCKQDDVVTDKGKPIIAFMQERYVEFNNLFKAKDIGEGIGVSSRSVSGSLKKLVTDGYVEKVGKEPTIYALTEKGSNTVVDKN